jgi:hypothetical protein
MVSTETDHVPKPRTMVNAENNTMALQKWEAMTLT